MSFPGSTELCGLDHHDVILMSLIADCIVTIISTILIFLDVVP